MRAVCADCELELKQELVRRFPLRVFGTSQLPSNLTELARPVGHHQRAAEIVNRRVGGTLGSIEAHAGEPAPTELVVARHVEAGAVLQPSRLIAPADHELRSA